MSFSIAPSVASFQGSAATAKRQAADTWLSASSALGALLTEESPATKKSAESAVDFQSLLVAALQLQAPTGTPSQNGQLSGASQTTALDTGQTAATCVGVHGHQEQGTHETNQRLISDSAAVSLPDRVVGPAGTPGPSQPAEAALCLPLPNPATALECALSLGQPFSSTTEAARGKGPRQPFAGLGYRASRVDKLTPLLGLAANDAKSSNPGLDLSATDYNHYRSGASLNSPEIPVCPAIVDHKQRSEVSEAGNQTGQNGLKESSIQIKYASLDVPLETHTPAALQDSQPLNSGFAVSGQIASRIIAQAEIVTRVGQTDFRLRLEPPELGTIRVHLSVTDQQISAHLVVHEEAAKQLIESQLESLRQRLTNAGISLGSFDVSHGGSGSQDAKKQRAAGAVAASIGPRLNRPKQPLVQLAATRASRNRIDLVV